MGVEIRVMFKSSQAEGATLRLPANRQAHERLATVPCRVQRQSAVLQGEKPDAIDVHADWRRDGGCVYAAKWAVPGRRSAGGAGASGGACYPSCVLPEPDVDKVRCPCAMEVKTADRPASRLGLRTV